MGLDSLKDLPVYKPESFSNYVPYRLANQPRITYIKTSPEEYMFVLRRRPPLSKDDVPPEKKQKLS